MHNLQTARLFIQSHIVDLALWHLKYGSETNGLFSSYQSTNCGFFKSWYLSLVYLVLIVSLTSG